MEMATCLKDQHMYKCHILSVIAQIDYHQWVPISQLQHSRVKLKM